jgi:hypothetical protein
MKTLSTIKLFAVASLLFINISCKKEQETMRFAAPNAANFKSLRNKALHDLTQNKTFNAEDGIVFTSTKGTTVTIHASCLEDADGTPITGEVQLSFVEIYDKGNMVITNKPVMGRNQDGDLLPLVTGGEFDIRITQGNKILKPRCSYNVSVPANLTGDLDYGMILWQGNINADGNLEWDNGDNAGGQEQGLRADEKTNSYNIWNGQFGWTNVDRFYSHTGPKTQIKVVVPSAYNNENAAVYLAYEDQPNLLAQLDTYNQAEKFFSEHYGFVPVGIKLHVIFTSESNGSIAYAIKEVTVADNSVIHISESELNTASQSQLVALINVLN